MLPLSLLCNLCFSRIILPRDEEDDSVQQSPKSSGPSPFKSSAQPTHESSECFPVVGEQFCSSSLLTVLTVRKKPLVFSGGGFSVTDSCTGEIVFRVDGRGLSSTYKLILMDAVGKPILTLHHKALAMHSHWYGFLGEKCNGQKPIFSVSKSLNIFNRNEVAEVFVGANTRGKKHSDYKVLGCYTKRHCSIYNGFGTIVAEVKRKCATTEVMLSKDVFTVAVKAGFDQAFIMGLIVILHQMSGEDNSL